MAGYLLGYDVGSSSVKAALLDVDTGAPVASATSPEKEMAISAPQPGWAEQHPELWWEQVIKATRKLRPRGAAHLKRVQAVGISYQMHGLVVVDKNRRVLRPAIIWCDSRAVGIGEQAWREIGPQRCLTRLLNSPGNFTASKLKWVQLHEPEIFSRIDKVMLPGDYIALRLSGEIRTTPSGLSEAILWDYQKQGLADLLLDYYGLPGSLLPQVVPSFSVQGQVSAAAAEELGLEQGLPVAYRGGDQPNNAFSLNVLGPGEIAATAGTSGVVFAVGTRAAYDPKSRVNTFVHVNHSAALPRYGILLCLNGTGALYSWLRRLLSSGGGICDYEAMNRQAAEVPIGAGGLVVLPYGNGAERTLENRTLGALIQGLEFNLHQGPHLLRAAQEGIVFALNYGLQIMKEMGLEVRTVRAGRTNMFQSALFGEAFATVTGTPVELYNTDGAQGAARGAGLGAGIYKDFKEAFRGLKAVSSLEPEAEKIAPYQEAYERWLAALRARLAQEGRV